MYGFCHLRPGSCICVWADILRRESYGLGQVLATISKQVGATVAAQLVTNMCHFGASAYQNTIHIPCQSGMAHRCQTHANRGTALEEQMSIDPSAELCFF